MVGDRKRRPLGGLYRVRRNYLVIDRIRLKGNVYLSIDRCSPNPCAVLDDLFNLSASRRRNARHQTHRPEHFMDTFQTIRERRSIKHYDPTHRFTEEEEKLLIDLALESPSSFNVQHWRLVNVKDPVVRARLRQAAFDQEQVTDASLIFAICVDVKAWNKEPSRYWKNAPGNVQDLLVPMLQSFYDGQEQLQRDEAIRSSAFIASTMMLTATAMGYDSCPLIGFDHDQAAAIIGLPGGHVISMLLAIGKGTRRAWPKPGYVDRSELLFEDQFPFVSSDEAPAEPVANGAGFWSVV